MVYTIFQKYFIIIDYVLLSPLNEWSFEIDVQHRVMFYMPTGICIVLYYFVLSSTHSNNIADSLSVIDT